MCIAIPGKIISVEGQHAKVDFSGNVVNVNVGIIEPQVGQYVLVHAGCAIEVMEKDKADELLTLFAELEEAEAEWNNRA
jgi:hydrogenase expression/formation protein HypC